MSQLAIQIGYFQLELALMVEKLQELRSIRVQKMKKQGKIFLFSYFFIYILCFTKYVRYMNELYYLENN